MFIRIHFNKRDSPKHEQGYSRDRNLNDKNNSNKTSTLITMISSHASTAGRTGQPASRLLQLARHHGAGLGCNSGSALQEQI